VGRGNGGDLGQFPRTRATRREAIGWRQRECAGLRRRGRLGSVGRLVGEDFGGNREFLLAHGVNGWWLCLSGSFYLRSCEEFKLPNKISIIGESAKFLASSFKQEC
jgi:hypothetical protein